ncbi:MAG TPA: hypothetical protein VN875_00185 [Candidatus Binatus sp.]|jgi:hypothetical protein|nr:hypothetical protein [Candidatus Binatus sp.]
MAATVSTVSVQTHDDALTICAISILAGMLANVLHEGLGHAATALLTGAQSGVLSTVAWSSDADTRLVAAGGTLANLAAGAAFWIALRSAKGVSTRLRFFLLNSLAFNLFAGTGYFFFSGVTNFGDWAVVIAGLQPHWLWRTILVVTGIPAYFGAVLLVGIGLVRYVGAPRNEPHRLQKLTFIPYFSGVLLSVVGGLMNPIGIQLVWQSALPGAAGADCGLLWLRYYIPKGTVPERRSDGIDRNYPWIIVAVILSLVFVFVLGPGITLHR